MENAKLKALCEYIESSERKMVGLETLLTSHPAMAPENGGTGELEKAEALIDWLLQNGFEKSQIQRYDAPDSRVPSGIRPNVVATISGESDEHSVWVMAHLDVVPTGDLGLWKTDPWKVVEKDGKLFGRGVEDNQQGLVSGVFAALALIKNNIKPAFTVKLIFMADEEVGSSKGMIWLLHNTDIFKKNDFYLIPDGGDPDGITIEVAEKNLLWLKVHVKGQQVHGSRPDQGKNACLAACELALKLNGLEQIFNAKNELFAPDRSTFQPTMRLPNVSGINIIPGEDIFCMDCRILPCYTIEEVLNQVEICCKEIEEKHGVEVFYETPQQSESPATSVDSPVVKKLAASIKEVHGLEAKTIGIGGGTVGAELRREGYDCVVWSTMDETAHMPNEYCIVKNIVKDAKTLVAMFI